MATCSYESWMLGDSGNLLPLTIFERMAPVKKVVAFLLMFAFICSLTISTTGCGKKDGEKKAEAKKDEPKKDEKKDTK